MFKYEYVQQLNDLELEVYNYVVKQKEKVLTMKIRELASEVHVSTTTVLRFCKKMQCNGYSEFLFRYRMYLEDADTGIVQREDLSLLLEFLKKMQLPEAEARLNEVIHYITEAEKVIFLGIGNSGILAKYGARYLSSVGKTSQYVDDPFYPVPRNYYEGTVIIVLSVSGETPELLDQIRRFSNFNCTLIAITNTETSTIAKMADIILTYYFPMDKLKFEINITTQIPTMYFLERIGKGVQAELANIEKV